MSGRVQERGGKNLCATTLFGGCAPIGTLTNIVPYLTKGPDEFDSDLAAFQKTDT